MELPFELSHGLIAEKTYWWCVLIGEFIGNLLRVLVGLVGEPDAIVGRVVQFFLLRSLTSRHRCNMPVRWSHLLTAVIGHLVCLSSTTIFSSVCLYH